MLLKTYASIRVKHMVLALIGEMLRPLTLHDDVTCDPIYFAGMDATALKTRCMVDGAEVSILAMFRVQRPTTRTWQIHLSLRHTGGAPTEHDYDFEEGNETSTQEAVIALCSTVVHYMRHCHPDWNSQGEEDKNREAFRHLQLVKFLDELRLSCKLG